MRKVSNQTAFLNAVKAPVKVAKARAFLPNYGEIERLPSEYQEVSYIKSTGVQYIDLGLVGDSRMTMEGSVKIGAVADLGAIIASQTNEGRVVIQDGPKSGDTGVWSFGSGGVYSNSGSVTANKAIIIEAEFGIPSVFRINGTQVSTVTPSSAYSTTANLTLFCRNNGNGRDHYSKHWLYYWKIYLGGEVVRDLVPCYRKSDHKTGVFDVKNGVFYQNGSSTEFEVGNDVHNNTITIGTDITSDDNLVSWKIAQDNYFFNAVSAQANLVLLGINWGDLIGQAVQLYFSVQTDASNDTWQEVSCGKYTVIEQTVDVEREKTTLTLSDAIAVAQTQSWQDYGLSAYPTSVEDLGRQLAVQYNMVARAVRKNLFITDELGTGCNPEILGNNKFRLSSNKTASSPTAFNQTKVFWLEPDTTYTLSFQATITGLNLDKTGYSRCRLEDSWRQIWSDSNGKMTFTTGATGKTEFGFYLYHDGGTAEGEVSVLWENVQLEKGDSKTTFEPYIVIPNADYMLTEDLWVNINDTSVRDVLSQIAGATGTLIRAGSDGETMELVSTKVPSDSLTLTYGEMKKWKLQDYYGDVNTVVLSRQPEEDNVVVQDDTMVSSAGGDNLLNPNIRYAVGATATSSAVTMTFEEDGVMLLNGTMNTGNNVEFTGAANVLKIPYDKTKRYYAYIEVLSGSIDVQQTQIAYECKYNGGASTYYKSKIITGQTQLIELNNIPEDTEYLSRVRFYCYVSGGSQYSTTFNNARVRVAIYTSPISDYELFKPAGNIAVKLGNNEILDDERELLAPPILESVKGLGFYTGEITTIGIGLHEVGDYLYVDDGNEPHKFLVTAVDLTIDGSIKETLKCIAPEEEDTNYAIAGSIYKSIWNTEIKVDKQGNQITSIVSRQDQTDEYVAEQFTTVYQNVENIITTVQAGGGGNLILNSVGYGKDGDGLLNFWDYGTGASASNVTSQTSPSSLSHNAVSGNEIVITGTSISQSVNLTANKEYTLSAIVDKPVVGGFTISLTNGRDNFSIQYPDQTGSTWERKTLTFTPTESYVVVTLTATSGTQVRITDLMLAEGTVTTWRQASGEIYNTQVAMDANGVKITSSQYAGDYVEITPLEFAGYSNVSGQQRKVFSLNRDITEVEKLKSRSEIYMPPIKVLPINNSSYQGWAFVKETS